MRQSDVKRQKHYIFCQEEAIWNRQLADKYGGRPWHPLCIPLLVQTKPSAQSGGDMLARIAGAVRFKEPLSFHTSLRIGGLADFFVLPHDLDDLRYALN